MPDVDPVIVSLAGAVADGLPIDWEATESGDLSAEERELIPELRLLESIHALHRRTEPVEHRTTTKTPSALGTWRHLEIREVIGTGAFGAVYRAWDPRLASEVALKVQARDSSLGTKVIEEASLLARVRHPNIVSIYGADRVDGEVGLWMELVRGRTLKELLKERGTFGAREAALVGLDLTRALAAVHGAGLVHRDVKAQNVMREEGGRIVLMDFGAGVGAGSGSQARLVGTPLYVAPEQFDRLDSTPQSDIYSLGVLLYHIVTGSFPIEADSLSAAKAAHARGDRARLRDVRPDLPGEFVRIVERATHPDVNQRYRSAGELEADLAQFVVHEERRTESASTQAPAVEARPWSRAVLAPVAVAVLLVAAGGWAYWSWRPRTTAAVSAAGLRSLAVLPFENMTGDPKQEYFVDGMTDLLTNQLGSLSSLNVTSRTSAVAFKGVRRPVAEIGRELRVDGVVEGSVALSGDRVRITVRIIHAGADVRLWGNTYERQVRDAFRLQAEIAQTIANELRAAMTDRERQRLEGVSTTDPRAQELYLRGRYLLNSLNREQIVQARPLLERAVEIDPGYALAWASLARCYTVLENMSVLSPAEAAALATHAASSALTHDSLTHEAYAALAEVRFKFDWDWGAADGMYQQALAANPSFSVGHSLYARFLSAAGDVEGALRHARRGEELDPVSAEMKNTVAMMLFYARRYSEADGKAAESIGIATGHPGGYFIRGRARAAMGQFEQALEDLRHAVALSNDPGHRSELGRVLALAGRPQDAENVLAQLTAPAAAAQDAAYIQIALGRHEAALAGLSDAIDQHSARILWLRVDPRVDPLRQQPAFEQLLGRLGGLPR